MHTAYQANIACLLATPRGVAVLPGLFLLLRGLAASVWWQKRGVEFDIPPGAVPRGRELDLSVRPCIN